MRRLQLGKELMEIERMQIEGMIQNCEKGMAENYLEVIICS